MPPEKEISEYIAKEPIAQKQESAMEIAGETLRSAAWTCLQMPMEGVTQLAAKASGKDLKAFELIDAPKPAEFGTGTWTAQHVGSYVGASFLAAGLHKTVGLAFREGAGTLGKEMVHGATTGAIFMGALMPTRNDSEHFWQERALNAAGGAAVFGGGAAFTRGVARVANGFPEGFLKRTYTSDGMFASMAKVNGGIQTSFALDDILKSLEKK